MIIIRKNIVFLLLLVLSAALPYSCRKDEPPYRDANNYVYNLMKTWYLWYDRVPSTLNIDEIYLTPNDFIYELSYKEYDKWSNVQDKTTHDKFYSQGQYSGVGFAMKWYSSNDMRVSFVFSGSEAYKKEIRRGWKVAEINNVNVSLISDINNVLSSSSIVYFTFIDDNDSTRYISIKTAEVNINSVLYKSVFDINGKKTGYFVLKYFLETTNAEIDSTFDYFQNNNIEELIVDLRYNGGGIVNVGVNLANHIIPDSADNKPFIKYLHNDLKSFNDTTVMFSRNNTLNLKRVVFITTKNTASASEMIINGLKPYLDVKLIGGDTYGKSVGAYGWSYQNFVVSPICFRLANAEGNTDFFYGLTADAYCSDDLSRDFGDTAEVCLKEALYYIEHDNFSSLSYKTGTSYVSDEIFGYSEPKMQISYKGALELPYTLER